MASPRGHNIELAKEQEEQAQLEHDFLHDELEYDKPLNKGRGDDDGGTHRYPQTHVERHIRVGRIVDDRRDDIADDDAREQKRKAKLAGPSAAKKGGGKTAEMMRRKHEQIEAMKAEHQREKDSAEQGDVALLCADAALRLQACRGMYEQADKTVQSRLEALKLKGRSQDDDDHMDYTEYRRFVQQLQLFEDHHNKDPGSNVEAIVHVLSCPDEDMGLFFEDWDVGGNWGEDDEDKKDDRDVLEAEDDLPDHATTLSTVSRAVQTSTIHMSETMQEVSMLQSQVNKLNAMVRSRDKQIASLEAFKSNAAAKMNDLRKEMESMVETRERQLFKLTTMLATMTDHSESMQKKLQALQKVQDELGPHGKFGKLQIQLEKMKRKRRMEMYRCQQLEQSVMEHADALGRLEHFVAEQEQTFLQYANMAQGNVSAGTLGQIMNMSKFLRSSTGRGGGEFDRARRFLEMLPLKILLGVSAPMTKAFEAVDQLFSDCMTTACKSVCNSGNEDAIAAEFEIAKSFVKAPRERLADFVIAVSRGVAGFMDHMREDHKSLTKGGLVTTRALKLKTGRKILTNDGKEEDEYEESEVPLDIETVFMVNDLKCVMCGVDEEQLAADLQCSTSEIYGLKQRSTMEPDRLPDEEVPILSMDKPAPVFDYLIKYLNDVDVEVSMVTDFYKCKQPTRVGRLHELCSIIFELKDFVLRECEKREGLSRQLSLLAGSNSSFGNFAFSSSGGSPKAGGKQLTRKEQARARLEEEKRDREMSESFTSSSGKLTGRLTGGAVKGRNIGIQTLICTTGGGNRGGMQGLDTLIQQGAGVLPLNRTGSVFASSSSGLVSTQPRQSMSSLKQSSPEKLDLMEGSMKKPTEPPSASSGGGKQSSPTVVTEDDGDTVEQGESSSPSSKKRKKKAGVRTAAVVSSASPTGGKRSKVAINIVRAATASSAGVTADHSTQSSEGKKEQKIKVGKTKKTQSKVESSEAIEPWSPAEDETNPTTGVSSPKRHKQAKIRPGALEMVDNNGVSGCGDGSSSFSQVGEGRLSVVSGPSDGEPSSPGPRGRSSRRSAAGSPTSVGASARRRVGSQVSSSSFFTHVTDEELHDDNETQGSGGADLVEVPSHSVMSKIGTGVFGPRSLSVSLPVKPPQESIGCQTEAMEASERELRRANAELASEVRKVKQVLRSEQDAERDRRRKTLALFKDGLDTSYRKLFAVIKQSVGIPVDREALRHELQQLAADPNQSIDALLTAQDRRVQEMAEVLSHGPHSLVRFKGAQLELEAVRARLHKAEKILRGYAEEAEHHLKQLTMVESFSVTEHTSAPSSSVLQPSNMPAVAEGRTRVSAKLQYEVSDAGKHAKATKSKEMLRLYFELEDLRDQLNAARVENEELSTHLRVLSGFGDTAGAGYRGGNRHKAVQCTLVQGEEGDAVGLTDVDRVIVRDMKLVHAHRKERSETLKGILSASYDPSKAHLANTFSFDYGVGARDAAKAVRRELEKTQPAIGGTLPMLPPTVSVRKIDVRNDVEDAGEQLSREDLLNSTATTLRFMEGSLTGTMPRGMSKSSDLVGVPSRERQKELRRKVLLAEHVQVSGPTVPIGLPALRQEESQVLGASRSPSSTMTKTTSTSVLRRAKHGGGPLKGAASKRLF